MAISWAATTEATTTRATTEATTEATTRATTEANSLPEAMTWSTTRATKLRAAVTSGYINTLFEAIAKDIIRKKLQHRVDIVDVTLSLLDNSDTSITIEERISQVLSDFDVVIVCFFGIESILKPLYTYLCSSKCVLKFVQFTFAGPNTFVDCIIENKLTPPTYPTCRFGRYMDQHMAEFVIGNIIARERNFALVFEQQTEHKWERSELHKYRTLNTLTIGLLGVGEIGKHVAKICKTLGMTVWGLTRSVVTMETACPYVDYHRQFNGLQELMESCDYVCSILPSTTETRGLLTEEHFKYCSKKKSIFINVGRGDVTKDATIVTAVKNGWLGGAILDVTEQEPLSKESPLWDLPGVTVIPHVAACSHSHEIADVFTDQLVRFICGQPLLYRIDLERGY